MKKLSDKDLFNLSLQNKGVSGRTPKTPFPILSVDYGLAYCGIAYSPDGLICLPLCVLPTDNLQSEIKQIIDAKNIKQVVLGIPIGADGIESPLSEKIRQVGKVFQSHLPVSYIDERFSSKTTLTLTTKKQQREDDLAAQHILEYFLAQK